MPDEDCKISVNMNRADHKKGYWIQFMIIFRKMIRTHANLDPYFLRRVKGTGESA